MTKEDIGGMARRCSDQMVVVYSIGSANGNTTVAVLGFRLIAALCEVWRSVSCARRSRSRWLLRLLGLLRLSLLLLL
jgi:hypothetical protein